MLSDKKHRNAGTSKPVASAKRRKRSVTQTRFSGADLIYLSQHPEKLRELTEGVRELNKIIAAIERSPMTKVMKYVGRVSLMFQEAQERIEHSLGCVICDTMFMPVRRDQKCCSKKCAGLLRQRRWRERQGEYHYNRKWNQHARAERAKLKRGKR